MTAPAKPDPLGVEPLSVACETCREPAGFPCVEWDYDDGPTTVSPHAARVRLAEKEARHAR